MLSCTVLNVFYEEIGRVGSTQFSLSLPGRAWSILAIINWCCVSPRSSFAFVIKRIQVQAGIITVGMKCPNSVDHWMTGHHADASIPSLSKLVHRM
jgi:hypothetical protein